MMGVVKRWGVAIVLLIAIAGALQFGILDFLAPDDTGQDCLDFYLLPEPTEIALQLVNEAGMSPEAVRSYVYLVRESEVFMSLSTTAGVYAQPICWQGDSLAPKAFFYRLHEPTE